MSLYILNRSSTKISDGDALQILEANQLQLVDDFAPAWGIVAPRLLFSAQGQPIPEGAIAMNARDTLGTDPDGALAYHAVESGRPVIHVLVDRILSQPGALLSDVCCALGHEIMEALEDLFTDEWSDVGDGTEEPRETVDRVQGGSYQKKLGGGSSLGVTNFLFPAAFNSQATAGPYDQCGILKAPRDIAPGGYKYSRPVGGGAISVFGHRRAALCYSRAAALRHGVDIEALRRDIERADQQLGLFT